MTSNTTGLTARMAYRHLVDVVTEISAIRLISYSDPPLLQERLPLTREQEQVVTQARMLKKAHELPFWDCLFRVIADSSVPAGEILSAAIYHHRFPSDPIIVSRGDVLNGAIDDAVALCQEGLQVGFLSEVAVKGGEHAHVPMLDFQQSCSPERLALVTGVARVLFGGGGMILESGSSYHAVGLRLMSSNELRRMLGEALMFGDIVDRRYIGHQLIEGRCCLRVSPRPGSAKEPRVVAAF